MSGDNGQSWIEPWAYDNGPGRNGEQRIYCPLHENKETSNSASASINWTKRVWHCMSCHQGGSVASLKRLVKNVDKDGPIGKATYNPFVDFEPEASPDNVRSLDDKRAEKQGKPEPINEAKVLRYTQRLKEMTDKLAYLTEERGLELPIIEHFQIGYDEVRERYTIPVRDADGNLVNIRRYRKDADFKMINSRGHGSPPRLYPAESLRSDVVYVCEGEWDALLHTQHDFPSVTGTHGAGTWDASWSRELAGKTVIICFDNDHEGRVAAKKVARSLAPHAAWVGIMDPPVEDEHGDLTDYWLNGGTPEDFKRRIAAIEKYEGRSKVAEDVAGEEPLVVPTSVIGSMDSTTNGRALMMQVTITGKKNPTYSVPHRVQLNCTLDAGPKCKVCPMNTDHEGEVTVTIGRKDIATVSQFIDATKPQVKSLLAEYIGAPPRCPRFWHDELENQTVEELFVTASIDNRYSTEDADYTQRRIYNVGRHETQTNTTATVVGTTIPNKKDRRNEFFSWELKESITSLDKFEMTPEMRKRLKVFQPRRGQSALMKCRRIAEDLSANVTHIIGRERLHMAMDLVWHSVLQFSFDGKVISRGWLELLVVGDTRVGKSETALHLADHYGLGHVIGCEGATFAGLVGAVKQVADAWTVQWGEITINDRRLVVLDEASGLSQEIISQLSDIRSRGVAQLTKAQMGQTLARCRAVWLSNPRKDRFIDEKKYDGIDIIEGLIGNPEDIARFDFAMSVSQADVPNERINDPDRPTHSHVYTSELCRDLILWAWSRRPDQVDWHEDAYRSVYKAAEWLGKRYADHPPLIQRTNVREKIARMAVALAARTFSTDASGERVVVTMDHVKGATNFLDELYSYDNFGYLRLSQRIQRNRRTAKRNRANIKKWLGENRRLLEFLLDRRGSFRSQDLEEMAHMGRDEVNFCLGKLTEAKMITKSKSQILLEPELHDLLKEMERER